MKPEYIVVSPGCLTCAHYHGHYEKRKGRYIPLFCGHCGYEEEKKKDPLRICSNWKEKEEREGS